jgi:hypothetical protein
MQANKLQSRNLVGIPELTTRSRGIKAPGVTHWDGNASTLQTLPEVSHLPGCWTAESALIHRIPRDQVHVRCKLVTLQQRRQGFRLQQECAHSEP